MMWAARSNKESRILEKALDVLERRFPSDPFWMRAVERGYSVSESESDPRAPSLGNVTTQRSKQALLPSAEAGR